MHLVDATAGRSGSRSRVSFGDPDSISALPGRDESFVNGAVVRRHNTAVSLLLPYATFKSLEEPYAVSNVHCLTLGQVGLEGVGMVFYRVVQPAEARCMQAPTASIHLACV